MDISFVLETISWPEALLRASLSMAFGFCLGYDREHKNKPVDFRVYMIVAMTTCLLAIMGEELVIIHNTGSQNADFGLLRIVQGVLTGIGFLGAGAIIKSGDENDKIIGTSTGASIWASGALGLMIGFGMYGLALLGFLLLAFTLIILGYLKRPLFHDRENETERHKKE